MISAATTTAPHRGAGVSEILKSAAATNPLKDAVKFYSADGTFTGATTPGASEDPDIWSYEQLAKNVNALTAGLQTLGYYGKGDTTILVWLPYTSPEYLTLVLAAANTGCTLMTIPPPENPNIVDADLGAVKAALEKSGAKMFIFDQAYQTSAGNTNSTSKLSKASSVLEALAPEISAADSAGYSGFSPLTGRTFACDKYPALEHVVHTDSTHIRGAITFRSILSYSDVLPAKASKNISTASYIVAADTGESTSTKDAISAAAQIGTTHALSGDQATKNGKIVVNPSHTPQSASAIIAALMHETLWIMPGDANDAAEIAKTENATLLQ